MNSQALQIVIYCRALVRYLLPWTDYYKSLFIVYAIFAVITTTFGLVIGGVGLFFEILNIWFFFLKLYLIYRVGISLLLVLLTISSKNRASHIVSFKESFKELGNNRFFDRSRSQRDHYRDDVRFLIFQGMDSEEAKKICKHNKRIGYYTQNLPI